MSVDLEKFSVAELKKLKGNIDSAIETRRQSELSDLYQKIVQTAEDAGFTLDEVLEAKSSAKRAVKPKYRNPNNPAQTWAGRGRKPAWVEDMLGAGGSLDDCVI